MAVYINKLTGNTIETDCKIEGEYWEEINTETIAEPEADTTEEIENTDTLAEPEADTTEEIENTDTLEKPKKNGRKGK